MTPPFQVAGATSPWFPRQTWAGSPCHLVIALLLVLTGCHPMPPGDLVKVKDSEVILLRGWRDMYSDGINELATRIEAEGYRTAVYGEAQWKDVADALIVRGYATRKQDFVLIGFSYGADHAIDVARRLKDTNLHTPLLITLDPVTPPKVPNSVWKTYNYYQSDFWDFLPWFRGIPLKVEPGYVTVDNIDVHDRPDLDDPSMSHKTIAGSEKIHREIIAKIKKQFPRGKM